MRAFAAPPWRGISATEESAVTLQTGCWDVITFAAASFSALCLARISSTDSGPAMLRYVQAVKRVATRDCTKSKYGLRWRRSSRVLSTLCGSFEHYRLDASEMSYAARLRQAYPFKAPTASVDHIVVGGGVIGLAVAAGLVNTAGRNRTTFLVERRAQVRIPSIPL